jgi:hypothetical protein
MPWEKPAWEGAKRVRRWCDFEAGPAGLFCGFSQEKWSERQDLNLRRLAPKASALARLSYAPTRPYILMNWRTCNSKVIKNQFANRHPNLQNTVSIKV